MPGLKLFVSNRLEILSKKLAEELKTPLSSLLGKEIIVVQSRGMERWLSMELARYHGICANCRFPFPNAIIYEIFRLLIPDLPEDSPFQPEIMTWKIMKLLPDCMKKSGFEALRDYVGNDINNLKLLQVSERIANTFDQYLVFRPKMIIDWEQGKEDHWQAKLWRMLIQDEKKPHLARTREVFLKKIKHPLGERKSLPERISIFGISVLPPFHIEIIAEIAKFIPVSLFLMNPCREYWSDILSDRESRRIARKYSEKSGTSDILFLERGNSLLASMGTLGKHFFDLIYSFDLEEQECFEEPGENNLLSVIQSDILNLRERGQEEKHVVAETDRSIEIHSCHSPMREVEILHDNLLALFEEDPDLMPKDILVMAPDIEPYTPFIQAVFDAPSNDKLRIPYSIADRSLKGEGIIINTFLAILNLWKSRFGAAQIINVLETRTVHAQFGLSEADVEHIKRWVEQSGIRWGIDEKTREEIKLPPFPENTWKFGLERLLLGYALPGKEEKLFQGILPYDYIEGSEAQVLGNFLAFTKELFLSVTSLDQPRLLSDWAKTLNYLLDTFFLPEEATERETMFLRRILNNLESLQEKSDFDEKIELPMINAYLKHQCEREGFGFGFMTGGVTFCTMLPMRSIPFKLICLLGMNDDAYPRESKHLSFDLMAKYPRPGDRSRRNDDRYLFLEAIFSSRKKLYISYIGQSIQDNSIIPPSVVVSELLDYIEQGFSIPGKSIVDQVLTRHRLQAFSPEYFKKDRKLFSYSQDNYEASRISLEARKNPLPFISHGLSPPDEEWRSLEVETLGKFFTHPAKFLLNQRLDIYLEEKAPILTEREYFELKNLEKYKVEEELLKRSLSGYDLKKFFPSFKASGKIPPGTLGECLYQKSTEEVEKFADTVKPYLTEKLSAPLELDLRISEFRLFGKIDNIFGKGLIHYRPAKVKAKDRIKLWIYHLVLNCLSSETDIKQSILLGKDSMVAYLPIKKSNKILGDLLKEYWKGLSRPLHFFPESSWAYAYSLLENNRTEEEAMSKAREQWDKDEYKRGESEDVYFQRCFGKIDPLDSEFKRIARKIFAPMLEHQEEG